MLSVAYLFEKQTLKVKPTGEGNIEIDPKKSPDAWLHVPVKVKSKNDKDDR